MRSFTQILVVAMAWFSPAICIAQLTGSVEFLQKSVNGVVGETHFSGPGDVLFAALSVGIDGGESGGVCIETSQWMHENSFTILLYILNADETIAHINSGSCTVPNPAFNFTAYTVMLYEQNTPPAPNRYLDGRSIPFSQANGGGQGG